MGARIAVDIGGTFTDVVLQRDSGERVTTKVLTTYRHPGEAVMTGIAEVLQRAALRPAQIDLIVHGTTLATNALIERRGAQTALLTTAGHRDALEMAHEDRFEQYDINIDRPTPLVPRDLRIGVRERMNHRGEILLPLNEADVHQALDLIDTRGIESIAIGYLHAYANPAHEQRSAELLRAARPELSITLASEVCPEIREYERLSTACANAYVKPLMARYLTRLEGELQAFGFRCSLLLMTSGGGLTTLQTAAAFPIRLVESGPAGGAILARHVAQQTGAPNMLSFDMGGTTAKLCLIDDYSPLSSRSFEVDRTYRFKKGSGLPVRIPVIEMVEIGAGGGSIARIDKLGRLQVGPHSAGSEPGPAAYGRGGDHATVTDADLQLGRIVADNFAGGAFALDGDAAIQALHRDVAEPLGLPLDEAAFGLSEIVAENMAAAARAHAAEFGLDLGRRPMVAFGGAAPLHAARLAEKLAIDQVMIPAQAGVGSAVGFLLAPIAYEVVRSAHQLLSRLDPAAINTLMQDMSAEANAVVRPASLRGALVEGRQAYMRYVGQGHEIAVPLPIDSYTEGHGHVFRKAFESRYRALYGRIMDDMDIETLSWTLTISAPRPDTGEPQRATVATQSPAPAARTQSLFDAQTRQPLGAHIHPRSSLVTDIPIAGPALITEAQTTTVVPTGWTARADAFGNLTLRRGAGEERP